MYLFDDALVRLPYVGQSVNLATRLSVHARVGRIGGPIYYRPLLGSTKTFREVTETIIMNSLGGKTGTANKVFPVSPARNRRLGLGITNY